LLLRDVELEALLGFAACFFLAGAGSGCLSSSSELAVSSSCSDSDSEDQASRAAGLASFLRGRRACRLGVLASAMEDCMYGNTAAALTHIENDTKQQIETLPSQLRWRFEQHR